MLNFNEWLTNADLITRLRLIETYYTFDAGQYNQVFRDELEKVIQRTSDPVQRKSLERLHDFDWVSYIAGAIRRIYRDFRQGQEAISDVVSKLLMENSFGVLLRHRRRERESRGCGRLFAGQIQDECGKQHTQYDREGGQ